MTPEELREIQGYVSRCKVAPLKRGDADPLYEPLDEGEPVRGGGSAIDLLGRALIRSDEVTCQLFAGYPGSGKTTELYRLKTRLEASEETHVVLINFEDYLNMYAPISVTDVLRIIAYGLDREASIQEAIAAGTMANPEKVEVGYLKRLFDFVSSSDVEIKNIGFDVYGAKLMLEIKHNPSFHQRVRQVLDLRIEVFVQEALDVMDSAILRLRAATRARTIMVIADGIEKLTYLGEEARAAQEAAVEAVFVTNAQHLRLPCHAIYTFPPWLRFRAPDLGAMYDKEPVVLPVIKIADVDGRPFQPGLDKLMRLLSRRIDIERVFGGDVQGTLVPIMEASGGYFRDFLRLVRNILLDVPSLPATPAQCQQAIAVLSETYKMAVRSPDVELLVDIARNHKLPEGDAARLASFGRLVDDFLVFAYRNGEEWYDLHPLVRELPMVKRRLQSLE